MALAAAGIHPVYRVLDGRHLGSSVAHRMLLKIRITERLRGLEKVSAELQLICLTHNLLKIWRHHNPVAVNHRG